MTDLTKTLLAAISRDDKTLNDRERAALSAILGGGDVATIPRIVRFDEAARVTGLSLSRIYSLVLEGRLRAVKGGGKHPRNLGIAEDSLRAFCEGGETW